MQSSSPSNNCEQNIIAIDDNVNVRYVVKREESIQNLKANQLRKILSNHKLLNEKLVKEESVTGAVPEILKTGGTLCRPTKKILDFRWSKKAEITL